jgi:hypothetical protein
VARASAKHPSSTGFSFFSMRILLEAHPVQGRVLTTA